MDCQPITSKRSADVVHHDCAPVVHMLFISKAVARLAAKHAARDPMLVAVVQDQPLMDEYSASACVSVDQGTHSDMPLTSWSFCPCYVCSKCVPLYTLLP